MVNKEGAVQVVKLVLNHPGKVLFGLKFQGVAFQVLGPDQNFVAALHICRQVDNAQATLLLNPAPFFFKDLRVDQDKGFFFIIAGRGVDDNQAQTFADLVGGQAHAGGSIHCFNKIVGQLPKRVVKASDRFDLLP